MIVLMAGLPGSGKSTLARELAYRTSGAVLDKDAIRSALFSSNDIEYSTEQDDFCQQVMLDTAVYFLEKNRNRTIFLDGRPFSRRTQIDQVVQRAGALAQPWRILECVCSEDTARRRLEDQTAARKHPAGNRDFVLYQQVKARFEEILLPKTIIDSELPLEVCAQRALSALR